MSRARGTHLVAAACLFVAVQLVASCSSSDDDPSAASLPADEWPADELVAPAYLDVGWVPEGFEVTIAGSGETPAYLSDDSSGTIESSLLVVPDSWDGVAQQGIIRVAAVAYGGLEGGVDQASAYYWPWAGGPDRELEIGGQPATYTAGGTGEHVSGRVLSWWDEVVLDLGEGWAIRVSGPDASEELLVDLAERASLDGELQPVLDSLPDGLRVVSRVTPEQIEAADGYVRHGGARESDVDITGNAVLYGDGTSRNAAERLNVTSVPGSEVNLDAIAWLRFEAGMNKGVGEEGAVESVEAVEVGGRPARLSRSSNLAALAFTIGEGSLVIVTSSDPEPLSDEDLLRIADSIESVDEATWEQLVDELN